jgi:hypothetical protein
MPMFIETITVFIMADGKRGSGPFCYITMLLAEKKWSILSTID